MGRPDFFRGPERLKFALTSSVTSMRQVPCDMEHEVSIYEYFVFDNTYGLQIHILEMAFMVHCNGDSFSV